MAQGVAYKEGGDGFLGRVGGQTGDTFVLAGFGLAGSGCFGRFASRVRVAWISAKCFSLVVFSGVEGAAFGMGAMGSMRRDPTGPSIIL